MYKMKEIPAQILYIITVSRSTKTHTSKIMTPNETNLLINGQKSYM